MTQDRSGGSLNIGMMCHSSLGGSARVATELAAELCRRDHRVHVFSLTVPPGLPRTGKKPVLHRVLTEIDDGDCSPFLYTDWSDVEFDLFLSRLLETIEQEKIDLLHFHYAVPFAALAQEVKRQLGDDSPAIVGTLHGTDVLVYGSDPERGPELSRHLSAIDVVTTVSRPHALLSIDVLGLEEEPLVIPNFVDLERFRPASPGSPRSTKRIAHVSNFRPIKDPQGMIRIFAAVRKRIDAELWLIGEGPEMGKVRSIVEEEELHDSVRFLGIQDDVAPFLSSIDLLLMTSIYESFCLVALEAMACGVPVVASAAGGLFELIEPGVTGALFTPCDETAATDLVVDLLTDGDKLTRFGVAARERSLDFGADRVVDAYEDLYRSALDAGSDRQPIVIPALESDSV